MAASGEVSIDDLSPEEVRVLGCLIEKESTTPDTYPLTLNSLRAACNQSTSRDPVVSYVERDIEQALVRLRERGLTRTVHSTSNRATKYRHVVPDALGLEPPEVALLAVLMLRGAQTVGELKSRTERQHAFASTDQVGAALAGLAARERPLVRQLDRQPGQKDVRWIHLLTPPATGTGSGTATGTGTAAAARSASIDPYGEATAEFYELLATAHWDEFGLQLIDLLAGVDPHAGPIVDIGTGTGVGLPYLTAAVPGARVHAIEPSKAMRVALHTRLAIDPSLREVTSVVPSPLASALLPDRACAVVVSAALGHLTDTERTMLWRFVAERMPPGAPAVVGVLPPGTPVEIAPTRYRRLAVGDLVYEGWQEGTPVDATTMAWTMTYRVLDHDEQIAEYRAVSTWRCDSVATVRREIERFGLTLTEHPDCVVVRTA